jgi:hypothetical protein
MLRFDVRCLDRDFQLEKVIGCMIMDCFVKVIMNFAFILTNAFP